MLLDLYSTLFTYVPPTPPTRGHRHLGPAGKPTRRWITGTSSVPTPVGYSTATHADHVATPAGTGAADHAHSVPAPAGAASVLASTANRQPQPAGFVIDPDEDDLLLLL